jgi:hypothetical protein
MGERKYLALANENGEVELPSSVVSSSANPSGPGEALISTGSASRAGQFSAAVLYAEAYGVKAATKKLHGTSAPEYTKVEEETLAAENAEALKALSTAVAERYGARIVFPPGTVPIDTSKGVPLKFQAHAAAYLVGAGRGSGTVLYNDGTRLYRTKGQNPIWEVNGTGTGSAEACGGSQDLEFHGGGLGGDLVLIERGLNMSFLNTSFLKSLGAGFHAKQIFNCYFTNCRIAECGTGRENPAFILGAITGEGALNPSVVNHFIGCEWEANTGTDISLQSTEEPEALAYFVGGKIERQLKEADYPMVEMPYARSALFSSFSFNCGGSIANLTGEWASGSGEKTITLTSAAPAEAELPNGTLVSGNGLPIATNLQATWTNGSKVIKCVGRLPSATWSGTAIVGASLKSAVAGIPAGATISTLGAYNATEHLTEFEMSENATATNASPALLHAGGTFVVGGQGTTSLKVKSTAAAFAVSAPAKVVLGGATSRLIEIPPTGYSGGEVMLSNCWFAHNGAPDYYINASTGMVFLTGAHCVSGFSISPIKYVRLSADVTNESFRWSNCIFQNAIASIGDERATESRDTSESYPRVIFNGSTNAAVKIGAGHYLGYPLKHGEEAYVYGWVVIPPDWAVGTSLELLLRFATSKSKTEDSGNIKLACNYDLITPKSTDLSTISPTTVPKVKANAGENPYTVDFETFGLGSSGLFPGKIIAFQIAREGSSGEDTYTGETFVTHAELVYKRTN